METAPDEPFGHQSSRAARRPLLSIGTALAVAALTIIATSALADDTAGKRGATAKRTFLQSASNGGLAEVELGKLAEQARGCRLRSLAIVSSRRDARTCLDGRPS